MGEGEDEVSDDTRKAIRAQARAQRKATQDRNEQHVDADLGKASLSLRIWITDALPATGPRNAKKIALENASEYSIKFSQ